KQERLRAARPQRYREAYVRLGPGQPPADPARVPAMSRQPPCLKLQVTQLAQRVLQVLDAAVQPFQPLLAEQLHRRAQPAAGHPQIVDRLRVQAARGARPGAADVGDPGVQQLLRGDAQRGAGAEPRDLSGPGHRFSLYPASVISVLLPARNAAPTIEAALRGILGQPAAPPFVVVCVDDASSAGTAEPLE